MCVSSTSPLQEDYPDFHFQVNVRLVLRCDGSFKGLHTGVSVTLDWMDNKRQSAFVCEDGMSLSPWETLLDIRTAAFAKKGAVCGDPQVQ